jgi:hypothetical protein
MDAHLNEFYGPWKAPDGSALPARGNADASPAANRFGSRLQNISTDELISRLMTGSPDMQDDRAAIGRELRARLGGVLSLSAQEAAAIESMVKASATAVDVALLRHALADAAYGDSDGGEITAGGDPPRTAPKPAPERASPGRAPTTPDPAAAAGGTRTPAQPERGSYRYAQTGELIRHFMRDRASFSYIELDLMLDELSTRASYFKDERAGERLKWLGQLRWGLLSDEDALRLTALLPRTAIEIMQLFAAGTREMSPGNLFASMELIAHGAYGGWMTGHNLANCKFLIKKLLLVRARSRGSPVSDNERSAINAFVDASGPGRDTVGEWQSVAALLP